MILLLALVGAVLVALPLGGKLGRLAHLRLKLGWVMILALALQFYATYFPAARGTIEFQMGGALLIGSYVLLLVAVWCNRGLRGMRIVGLGLLMNLLVIVANGGYMPMSPEALAQVGIKTVSRGAEIGARIVNSKDILLTPVDTRLWFLSDVFVVPRPWPVRFAFSAGDILIALGGFVLVLAGMGVDAISRLSRPARACVSRP